MIILLLITLVLAIGFIVSLKKGSLLFMLFGLLSIIPLAFFFNNTLSFFFNSEAAINTKIYEPVTIIQTTENSVVEVIEDTYYKDKKGEYYVISEEPPKFKDNLWNPIVYAEMKKVDYPVLEYQGELNE